MNRQFLDALYSRLNRARKWQQHCEDTARGPHGSEQEAEFAQQRLSEAKAEVQDADELIDLYLKSLK